jgi:hypothetical protein
MSRRMSCRFLSNRKADEAPTEPVNDFACNRPTAIAEIAIRDRTTSNKFTRISKHALFAFGLARALQLNEPKIDLKRVALFMLAATAAFAQATPQVLEAVASNPSAPSTAAPTWK